MYLISYLTDILAVTNLFHHPQLLTQPNFKILIGFQKLLVIILSLGVI